MGESTTATFLLTLLGISLFQRSQNFQDGSVWGFLMSATIPFLYRHIYPLAIDKHANLSGKTNERKLKLWETPLC